MLRCSGPIWGDIEVALLQVNDIDTRYGLSRVLFGVSLRVEAGEIVSLIGRNGVGKTTTMRSIMGLTVPFSGSILWEGAEIIGRSTHEIARMGIGYVPEERRIFPDLTVWENLDIASRPPASDIPGWTVERVYELFPVLERMHSRRGGYLSGGEQQMLTIGRSLMGNPRLLLLDEPSEGLAPLIVATLRERIGDLRAAGLSIVLAEQNLEFVLALSDRIYVLEKGEVKFTGTPDEVHENEELVLSHLTV